MTGIDCSQCPIAYAKDYAIQHKLEIEHRYQDYLELADANRYQVAVSNLGDF